MLSVRNLRKVYRSKKAEEVVALDGVSIDFPETGFVFLLGKSGSGKSTLLNAIGGLDKFDGGEIIIKGKSSKDFSQSDFDSYRNTFIGFIFQEYNILENFSVAKNLALALELQGKKVDHEEVMKLLRQVEMEQYAKRKPNELSGGQKQRVAIARALIKNPEIIMADEPTGALDSNTGKQVMETLKELSKTKLIIVVSHDREFAELYGDRIIELKDGKILHDVTKKEIVAQETKSGIKVIDNDIVFIKKGQEITPSEMKTITDIINAKTKEGDAFISFNKNANEKLKEGAKINDEGNKEKFLETEKEDVKVKQYNPNSLKLIKSRLGFMDSLKMGASSLKNKVGKLIFTILLSFFAFTCFGIIDALSQWNRADSVYQAMKITNTQSFVMKKTKISYYDGYSSTDDKMVSETDLKTLKEQFPDHTFIASVGGSSWSRWSVDVKLTDEGNYESFSTNNDYKKCGIGAYVNVTKADLDKLGFELRGDLPSADDEIAIPQLLVKCIVAATANKTPAITEENIIGKFVKINDDSGSREFKVVGVVDDKTDFSRYDQMSETDLQKDYMLEQTLLNSAASLGYVNKNVYENIKSQQRGESIDYAISTELNSYRSLYLNGINTMQSLFEEAKDNFDEGTKFYYNEQLNEFYYKSGSIVRLYKENEYYEMYWYDWNNSYSSIYKYNKLNRYGSYDYLDSSQFLAIYPDSDMNAIPDAFEGKEVANYDGRMFLLQHFSELVGDKSKYLNSDNTVKNLADGEMIIPLNDVSSSRDDAVIAIEAGTLTYSVYEENYWNDPENPDKQLKVIGLMTSGSLDSDSAVFSTNTATDLSGYYGTYSFLLSSLTGNAGQDKALISVCETYDDDNIRYTVQNGTTTILDMLEEIIEMAASIFVWIALAFAVFAAVLLMNFISTSINYKKREIGVLRALGARGSDIFGIFLNESTIIALINFALASVATIVGCSIINSALISSLGYSITLLNVGIRQVILILLVSWGSAFLASLIPTSKISRKKPIDAINNR